ncbi:MAG: hypothetical protein IPG50_21810 [Myxococcales bacterium]|nr:hypothetical protein [Myxococcales bacterium]
MANRVAVGSELPVGEQPQSAATFGDRVEEGLARALEAATAAGRFDVVAQVAEELKARRLAREGVADLATARRKGRSG